jgi:hypothetical protein
MNNRPIVALTLVLVSAAWACGSSSSPGNTNTNTVTFTMVYSDIISTTCLPCHAPGMVGDSAGALDMSTQALAYSNLQKDASGSDCKASGLPLVVPGNAATSLLAEKVESAMPPCGSRMPFECGTASTPCLTAAQIQEIVDWINGGAEDE